MKRGQAAVELALGLLVFVSVLMFGVHFAEMGHISLKVQEAGTYPVWEATGRKVEVLETSSTAPFNSTLGGPNAVDLKAKQAYRDFDGLTGHNKSSTVVLAFTKANRLDVQCGRDNGLSFAPSATAGTIYRDTGGLQCQASAEVEAFRIPTHFLDDTDGFFKEQHRQPGWLHLCSVGIQVSGGCPGQLSVLTNDWGLSGDAEADACNVYGGGGCDYSNIVQRMWAPVGTAGLDFATRFAGAPPTDETIYNFSYKGVEDGYINDVGGEGQPTFNTGGPGAPSNVVPATTGHNCFLGMGGNGCS